MTSLESIGKLKGDVVAQKIVVDGLFRSKGRIDVDEMKVEGVARAFRDINVEGSDAVLFMAGPTHAIPSQFNVYHSFFICYHKNYKKKYIYW